MDYLAFGLKIAPSLFQKAMVRIFEPILSSTLVYIDDILLFSETFEKHITLLYDFAILVENAGVMLSGKKMILAVKEIQFLGMIISQGYCKPGQHSAQAIQNFP